MPPSSGESCPHQRRPRSGPRSLAHGGGGQAHTGEAEVPRAAVDAGRLRPSEPRQRRQGGFVEARGDQVRAVSAVRWVEFQEPGRRL